MNLLISSILNSNNTRIPEIPCNPNLQALQECLFLLRKKRNCTSSYKLMGWWLKCTYMRMAIQLLWMIFQWMRENSDSRKTRYRNPIKRNRIFSFSENHFRFPKNHVTDVILSRASTQWDWTSPWQFLQKYKNDSTDGHGNT